MVTADFGTPATCRRDSRACRFVRQIAANLGHTLVNAFKENCLFIFDEAREMARRTLCKEKAFTGRDFKALVHEFVVV